MNQVLYFYSNTSSTTANFFINFIARRISLPLILLCLLCLFITKDAFSTETTDTIPPTYTTTQLWIPESTYGGYDEYIPDNSVFTGKKKEEYFYLGEIHAQSLNNTAIGNYTFHNCEWPSEPPSWTRKLPYLCNQKISGRESSKYVSFYLAPTIKLSEPRCLDNTYSELFVANSGGHRCRMPVEFPEYEGDCYSDDLNPRENAYKLLRAQKEQFVTAANELKSRISNLSSALNNSSPCAASKMNNIKSALGYSQGENLESQLLNTFTKTYSVLLPKILGEVNISIENSDHIRATKSRSSSAGGKVCYRQTGKRNYRLEIDEDILSGAQYRGNASQTLGHEFGHLFNMTHTNKYDIGVETVESYNDRITQIFIAVKDSGDSLKKELEFKNLINNPYILQRLLKTVGKTPCAL